MDHRSYTLSLSFTDSGIILDIEPLLIDIETVANLISSTTTKTGLKAACTVDLNSYETGIKITPEQKENINITLIDPNGKWNYIIRPNE